MAILKVHITKGGPDCYLDVNTDDPTEGGDLSADMYSRALEEGLKVLLNKGQSKIILKGLEGEDLAKARAAALAKGKENLQAVRDGTLKKAGSKKAAGATGAVMTEARRLARNLVKDEMKRAGIKISHVEASEITKAANALLSADPTLIEQAKANLAEREKVPVSGMIDIKALIKESPMLVKKAEARKSKAKETLSAKQAGKVKTRAKGQPQAQA